MNTKEVLLAAAEHLDRVGLHKGNFIDAKAYRDGRLSKDVPCCTIGALNVVCGLYDGFTISTSHGFASEARKRRQPAVEAITRHLQDAKAIATLTLDGEPDEAELLDIPEWNDAPGRTKEEVVAMLKEAAAKLP